MFELITTDSGTYGKIDNNLISGHYNSEQREVSLIEIGSTWNLTGTAYYDDFELLRVPEDKDLLFLSAGNSLVKNYAKTDFSSLYPELGLDEVEEGRFHGNDLRSLLNTAEALALDYKVNGRVESLERAKALLKDSLDYGHWQEVNPWSVAIPASSLIEVSRLLWDDFDSQTRERVVDIVVSRADSFSSRVPASGYRNDSKAEENAWNAAFLASAANFLAYHPHAEDWEKKARCFAFHTITTSEDERLTHPEMACGIDTQTVWDDFSLDNHDQHPNAVYSAAVIWLLAEGAAAYQFNDRPVPEEFKHNVVPLWNKLKTYIDWNTYQYKTGADWSGAISAFFSNGPLIDYYFKTAIPELSSEIDLDRLLSRNWLFYYQISSEYTEPVSILDSFDQTNKGSDGYNWFLNSVVAHYFDIGYLYKTKQEVLVPKTSCSDINQEVFGSFSREEWKPLVWSGTAVYECDEGLKIYSSDLSSAEAYSHLIPVSPKTTYRVSYKVKTDNLQPESNTEIYGTIVAAEYNQSAKEEDKVTQNRIKDGRGTGVNLEGTHDWSEKGYTFTTSSETHYLRLRAMNGGWGKASGTAWFDKVRLEETEVAGDLNGDSQVTPQDLKILLKSWGDSSVIPRAEFNGDGMINGIDFGTMIGLVQ